MTESVDDPICLVVDDSEFDRRLIARAIRKSGLRYRLRVAPDLTAARKAFGHPEVSAIILDNSLPDGRGVDFAVEAASDPWFRRLVKLIVTDLPSPFMFEKAKGAGVDQVLLKSEVSASTMRSALHPTSRQR